MSIAELEDNGVSNNAAPLVSRRLLLQAGAAAGVAAAVWVGPEVSHIGRSPAYAAVCSAQFTYYLGSRNTSCNCELNDDASIDVIKYKELAGIADPFPGSVGLYDNDCPETGTAVTDAGSCAPGSNPEGGQSQDGTAGVCVDPTDSDLYCKVRVEIRDSLQNPLNPEVVVDTGVVQGPNWVPLPLVPCASVPGNSFTYVYVICSPVDGCV